MAGTMRTEKTKVNEMIGRYLLALGKIQDHMFELYNGKEAKVYANFYDMGALDGHIRFCEELSKCYERGIQELDLIYDTWNSICSKLDRFDNRKEFASIPKNIAALCLLEGKYYEAIKCLWDVICLNSEDLNAWFLIMKWAIFLEEWVLLSIILSREDSTLKSTSEGYQILIECVRLVLKLHTVETRLQPEIGLDIARKLQEVTALGKKTFLFSHCQAILRSALVHAARLPKADLQKLGDPLHNRTSEADICEVILRNRLPSLFKCDQSSSIHKKAANTDEFLKMCSSIAEFFEAFNTCMEEFMESGLPREAEAYCVGTWKYGLTFGMPYRALRPVVFLFYLKSVTTVERHMLNSYGDCINALLSPRTSIKCSYLSTPKHTAIRQSSLRRGSVVDDSFSGLNTLSDDLSNCVISSVNILEKDSKDKVLLYKHVSDCVCGFCVLKNTSWHFALQIRWISLLFQDFSLQEYEKFRKKVKELEAIYLKVRYNNLAGICSANGSFKESFICPQFSVYLIRATVCVLLQDLSMPCLGTSRRDHLLKQAIETCELTPLTFRSSLLTLRIVQRLLAGDQIMTSVGFCMPTLTLAYDEFKDFGHLFFREWRQRSSNYLALKMSSSWHKALYFFESTATCVRQFARLCGNRKEVENSSKFRFESTTSLIEAVSQLPEELTYLNLSLCDDGSLYLTRCHRLHEPIVILVTKLQERDAITEEMRNILIRSDESVAGSITDSVVFWDVRKKLNKEVEALLHKMQETWFTKSLALLLLPLNYGFSESSREGVEMLEKKFFKAGYTKKSSVTLARLMDQLEEQEWVELSRYFGKLDSVREDLVMKIQKYWKSLYNLLAFEREERNAKHKYTLMTCPPSLSFLPWECLPIYERSPLVTRIPSFHFFEHISQGVSSIPKSVDGRNCFYVLNPGGDLANTQKRMTSFVEKYSWRGVIGSAPSREELQGVLAKHDLFLYMGHGSGGRHFGRSSIRESDCKAVSILMGCSSARILDEGSGFDGRAAIYEYLIARCPCIVGCLWMVTDGDIDRFFIALAEFCFGQIANVTESESEMSNASATCTHSSKRTAVKRIRKNSAAQPHSQTLETCKLLIRGVVEARKSCKLPFLTGGAVVSYGLPISSVLSGQTS